MEDQSAASAGGPAITLRQIGVRRAGPLGSWRIRWEVENRAPRAVEVKAARLPHGAFKSPKMRFEPALELAPGRRCEFELQVFCRGSHGAVTENAFVILEAQYLGESWRIFTRLRVVLDSQAVPQSATESITTQKAGFSGVNG